MPTSSGRRQRRYPRTRYHPSRASREAPRPSGRAPRAACRRHAPIRQLGPRSGRDRPSQPPRSNVVSRPTDSALRRRHLERLLKVIAQGLAGSRRVSMSARDHRPENPRVPPAPMLFLTTLPAITDPARQVGESECQAFQAARGSPVPFPARRLGTVSARAPIGQESRAVQPHGGSRTRLSCPRPGRVRCSRQRANRQPGSGTADAAATVEAAPGTKGRMSHSAAAAL